MKKRYLTLLLLTFFFVLGSCISKRLIQRIEFKNSSGCLANITCEELDDAIALMNGKSRVVDISNTEIVRMSFSDSNHIYQYDLSGLDIKAATDKEKSGKTFSGAVYWVYICTISRDKALSFKSKKRNDGLEEIILYPK